MNTRIHIALLMALLLALWLRSSLVLASPIWLVEKNGHQLYLGGTIHVMRAQDSIPNTFDTAYKKASHLIFETDIAALTDPNIQTFLMQHAQYPANQSLQTELSPDSYQALKQHCQSVGLPLNMLNHYRPGFIYLTLLGIELQKLGVNQSGVDKIYFEKAKKDQKHISGLEPLEQHLALILHIGKADQEAFIDYFLQELKQLPTQIEHLMNIWSQGNLVALNQTFIQPMATHYPALYKRLMVDRNQAWLPQLGHFLKTPETEFVLVGAAHLAGKDSLLTALKLKGYQISRL